MMIAKWLAPIVLTGILGLLGVGLTYLAFTNFGKQIYIDIVLEYVNGENVETVLKGQFEESTAKIEVLQAEVDFFKKKVSEFQDVTEFLKKKVSEFEDVSEFLKKKLEEFEAGTSPK